jgi:hypothetical protein
MPFAAQKLYDDQAVDYDLVRLTREAGINCADDFAGKGGG